MHLFAQSRLRDEPLSWAAGLAGDIGGEPGASVVLASAAQRAVNAGDLHRAEALARRSVALAKTVGEAFFGLEVLADVALFTGRLDVAEATSRQALEAGEDIGDDHAVTFARSNAALAAAYAGRFADAEAALRGRWSPPAAPSDLGWLAYTEGEVVLDRDPGRALGLLDQAVALADSVGNRYLGGVARVSACSLRARTGDPAEAMGAFASVIEGWRRQGAKVQQLTTLRNLVVLLARMGSAPEAALLLGAVERDTVAPTFGEEAARLARVRRWVGETLGSTEAARRMAAGAELDLDEAAEVALSWL
jgi:tetratricopeptide (TPR) repeat protein